MINEVEEDPSLDKQHLSAIREKIKMNQKNRLDQKKMNDNKQPKGVEQSSLSHGLSQEEKDLLIVGAVARDEQSNLAIEHKMDPYTEEDLIP